MERILILGKRKAKEKELAEDEMVGLHHRHEFEQALRDGEG